MKHNYLSTVFIALGLLVSITLKAQDDFKKIGYLPTYRFGHLYDLELERLTHMNVAFAVPTADGTLSTGGVDISPTVAVAHSAGLDVYIAISGAGTFLLDWAGWLEPGDRSEFIHNIIEYTLQHNLQGIDIDIEWSYVNEDYSGFVLELRDSVDKYDLGLSAALPGTHRYPEVSDEALEAFDWINIMAYDLTGPWAPNSPGPHSPYSFAVQSVNYWANQQHVPKDKLVLGVPFYGYNFNNPAQVVSVTFRQMVAINSDYAFIDQVGEIYYNGHRTIEYKAWLAKNQLSGIMIWEIGQDSFDDFSLLKKIDEVISGDPTSSSEPTAADQFLLYPNPTSDLLHVEVDRPQQLKLSLLTMSGRVMQQLQSDQQITTMTVDDLPAAIYLLVLEGEHFTKTFKVSKR